MTHDISPDAVKDRVRRQFGDSADDYVHSPGHASGDDLATVVSLAEPRPADVVLDIATGGGHTALALAPRVDRVVATDLTPAMLAAAERFIRGQGMTNVSFELADAENLPFADATFDVVTTRIAPHHFASVGRYVLEVARVLREGGIFVLEDTIAPDDPAVDSLLNEIERRRDPSHVRCYTVAEWLAFMAGAGLTAELPVRGRKTHPFDEWTARMKMSPSAKEDLERIMLDATPAQAAYLAIESDRQRRHIRSWSSEYFVLRASRVKRASCAT